MEINNKTTGMKAGVISVMTIFAILCMTVFSVLSLMTAKSDLKQTEKAVEAITDYYKADSKSSIFVREIYEKWKSGASFEELKSKAEGLGGTCIEGDTSLTVNYVCGIDAAREIDLSFEIGDSFKILKWQTIGIGDWTPDENLNLWEGE